MAHPAGETRGGVPRLDFDHRLKLEFHGSKVTSDAGLLPYRELDDAPGLTEIAGDALTDTRRGKNGRHGLAGQFRQSVFGRLGGCDDVNDAERLSLDPVMRWIGGGKAIERRAASASQMERFETASSATRPSGSSFTPWPTISPTSCGCWPCRRLHSSGRRPGTRVADHAAGDVGEDRCESGQPWRVRHVPTGRGCRAEGTVPANPEPDR